MANLVLAFGEALVGAILLDAAVKGDSIANVVTGKATVHKITGNGSSGAGGDASAPANVPAGTYVNPVPGASLERTDEGVDYQLGSQGFLAPGRSKVINTSAGFFKGGSIVLEFLDGPYKGAQYFVAEGVKPAAGITNGAIVAAGQKVAEADQSLYISGPGGFGNIEAGWWRGSGPLAQTTGGYHPDGAVTAAGASWDSFVRALGGVAHAADSVAIGSLSGVGLGDL